MMMLVLPQKIADKRKATNLSRYKLAINSGLPISAIYRLESGETKKTNHLRAREIAKALGCKVEDIFSPINKGA